MKKATPTPTITLPELEHVPVDCLREHPRNYKDHPEDQLGHIRKSLEEHGFYRNIIIAREGTILAGHGVVKAAIGMGLTTVPVIRLDLDPEDPKAIKVMVSDNEIGKLAETDDRALTDLLTQLVSTDDLLGTGFDPQSLAAYIMVTKPPDLLRDKAETETYENIPGLPEFQNGTRVIRLVMQFQTPEARDAFITDHAIVVSKKGMGGTDSNWSAWWPPQEPDTAEWQGGGA